MIKNHRTVRGALSKVTTRYRKEFPKLKLETQGTEGEIEMLRIVYPLSWTIWNFRTISMSHRGWRRTSVFYRESLIGKNPCIKFAFERVAARKNWDWKENVSNHFRLCRRTTSFIAIRTHVERVRLMFYPFHLDSEVWRSDWSMDHNGPAVVILDQAVMDQNDI